MVTALTLGLNTQHTSTLLTSTACRLAIGTSAGTNGTTTIAITSSSSGYGECYSRGNAGAFAGAGSMGVPSGNGWFLEPGDLTIAGNGFPSGNWTPTYRIEVDSGTVNVTLYMNLYRYNAGTYTLLHTWSSTKSGVGTSFVTCNPGAWAAGEVDFATAGDTIYIDLWPHITATTGSPTLFKYTQDTTAGDVNASAALITPGYLPIQSLTVRARSTFKAQQTGLSVPTHTTFKAQQTGLSVPTHTTFKSRQTSLSTLTRGSFKARETRETTRGRTAFKVLATGLATPSHTTFKAREMRLTSDSRTTFKVYSNLKALVTYGRALFQTRLTGLSAYTRTAFKVSETHLTLSAQTSFKVRAIALLTRSRASFLTRETHLFARGQATFKTRFASLLTRGRALFLMREPRLTTRQQATFKVESTFLSRLVTRGRAFFTVALPRPRGHPPGFGGVGVTPLPVSLTLPLASPYMVAGVALPDQPTLRTAPALQGTAVPAGCSFQLVWQSPSSPTTTALANGSIVSLTFALEGGRMVTGLVHIESHTASGTFQVTATLVQTLWLSDRVVATPFF